MLGYIVLFAVGLLFVVGLAYIARSLLRLKHSAVESEGDPLLDSLEVKAAEQQLKSGKAIGIVLYSILFCGLIWYLFHYEPAPAYSLTSTELYEQFSENKRLASSKYNNEYVLVTGRYMGDELIFGSPAILLQTSVESGWVQCNFEGSRAAQASALKFGQEVSLKGRVLGQSTHVVLEKCSVSSRNLEE